MAVFISPLPISLWHATDKSRLVPLIPSKSAILYATLVEFRFSSTSGSQ